MDVQILLYVRAPASAGQAACEEEYARDAAEVGKEASKMEVVALVVALSGGMEACTDGWWGGGG